MASSSLSAIGPPRPFSRWASWIPCWLGLLGFLAVGLALDVASDCRWSADGPGVTFDEGFNVEVGVYLVESLWQSGVACLHPATWSDIYNAPNYNPDHPPLGRLTLGAANALLTRIDGAEQGRFYVLTYARVGAAACYGLTLWLVARFALLQWGAIAATASGLSMLLAPRLFGHAHLAALETPMNLAFAAFVLGTAASWQHRTVLRARDGLFPGILLGMALLTKMQAIFLPAPVFLWVLVRWRGRGWLALATLGLTAGVVFLLGWPWLWPDPLARAAGYFARSHERITLYCYYLGERYADRDVPWHYPFVMFAVTTPLIWLLLGTGGILTAFFSKPPGRAEGSDKETEGGVSRDVALYLLANILLPLTAFALPGVANYDGERLFLVVWPIFAVFVGLGAARFCEWSSHQKWRVPVFVALVIGVGLPLVSLFRLHPIQLSYYNELVGGLRGAAALGFEPTYWGDAVTPAFLRERLAQIPSGGKLAVAPVLHPATLTFLRRDSELRHRPDVVLEAYDDQRPDGARDVLVIRRHADPWESLTPPPEGTETLGVLERSGVVLTELLRLP